MVWLQVKQSRLVWLQSRSGPIAVGGFDIEQVSKFKLLGVHLIEDLTWAVHCDYTVGTLRSNDADGTTRTSKKTIGFISKTTTLHVHHAFFASVQFSARFSTTTTWTCLISRFMEDVNILFLFLYLDMAPRNSPPGGFAYIWQSKRIGIIAMKTERTQIHFLSDVLIAVSSLDLKVPSEEGQQMPLCTETTQEVQSSVGWY